MALISAYGVSRNLHVAFVAGLTAMVVEALPLDDYDNLALPVTVGMVAQLASVYWH